MGTSDGQDGRTEVFAVHGWECTIPAGWHVQVLRGTWRGGYAVLVEDRTPRLNLTWERGPRNPDADRTIRSLGRRIRREHRDAPPRLVGRESLHGADGSFARWVGSDGDLHAAVVRDDRAAVTFVVRQLAMGPGHAVKALALSCRGQDLTAPIRWRLFGLDCRLPADWRLEGVHHLVGLTRAVWMHYVGRRGKVDQVLIMRRFACASRILRDTDLRTWLEERREPRETTVTTVREADVLHLETRIPGPSWWDRVCRRFQTRHLYAWIEEDADRLNVQEWKGSGASLECLRPQDQGEDSPSSQTPVTTGEAAPPHGRPRD